MTVPLWNDPRNYLLEIVFQESPKLISKSLSLSFSVSPERPKDIYHGEKRTKAGGVY